eukprot:312824_1
MSPIDNPTHSPFDNPTYSPIDNPTTSPITDPTTTPTDNPISSITSTNNPTKYPTKNPIQAPTYNPVLNTSASPTSIPTTTSNTNNPSTRNPTFSPTRNPSEAPINCENNDSLENDDCTDNGCEEDKPYLDFSLSFNVCKKQPFNGNRYGLWDAIANCLCELGKNGKINYNNLDTRRLESGDNVCDLNVVKYGMDSLMQPISSTCDTNGYRFHFGIQGCGECIELTQSLNKLSAMTESQIFDEMAKCANWFAKRMDTIGFGEIHDLKFNIEDEIKEKCDVTAGVERHFCASTTAIIFSVLFCMF